MYFEQYSQNNEICEKRYSGSGTFGASGTAFFRVSVLSQCHEDPEIPEEFYIRYCFDGCTTGECSVPITDISTWTLMDETVCSPLYGEHYAAAPPSACGACMEGYSLSVSV